MYLKMTVFEEVCDLKSFERCKDKVIPRKKMGKILESGRNAPSPGNVQTLEFIVVEDEERKEMFYRASGDDRVLEVPNLIIVISNVDRMRRRIKNETEIYCNAEAACAIQNMRLVARSEGIGSSWVSGFDREDVKHKFRIPEGKEPLAAVLFAYTDDEIEREDRFGMNEVCFYDVYGNQIESFWDDPAWRGLRVEKKIHEKKAKGFLDKLRELLDQHL